DTTASVTHLAAASLNQVGLRGLIQSPGPATDTAKFAETKRALDAQTGFSQSRSEIANQIGAFEAFVQGSSGRFRSTAFYVSGHSIETAFAILDGVAIPFARIDEHAITADVPRGSAVTALIQFADGSSTMVASLYGYVGNVVVAKNGVINVSYLPRDGAYDRDRLNP